MFVDRKKLKRLIWERDSYLCFYCGKELNEENRTVDHLMPESRGGRWSEKNLVAACRPCNRWKSHLTLDEHRLVEMFRRGLRILWFPGELRKEAV